MGRPLCHLVVALCWVLLGVTSMPSESPQQEDPASCSGPLFRFPGQRLLFVNEAGTDVSLTVDTDGAESFSCYLREESDSEESTENAQSGHTIKCSRDEFLEVFGQCYELMTISQGQRSRRHTEKRSLIYPGTLWCGAGDNAGGDFTKLGKYNQTDSCCRAHDFCKPQIPGVTYDIATNLRNWSLFTRLHCDCETKLRACLKSSKDGLGTIIGELYFNVVTATCFNLVSQCPNNGTSADCMKWTWISAGNF